MMEVQQIIYSHNGAPADWSSTGFVGGSRANFEVGWWHTAKIRNDLHDSGLAVGEHITTEKVSEHTPRPGLSRRA